MCPFSVTLERVPDQELGPLLIRLAQAGVHDPIIKPVDADGTSGRTTASAVGRIGGSYGSVRGSRISGRVGASTTRATASSLARRGPKAPFTLDLAKRLAKTSGGATESTSSPF